MKNIITEEDVATLEFNIDYSVKNSISNVLYLYSAEYPDITMVIIKPDEKGRKCILQVNKKGFLVKKNSTEIFSKIAETYNEMKKEQTKMKENTMDLRLEKPLSEQTVILCAFRYALGRQTYVVEEIATYLKHNWKKLSVEMQTLIQKEIKAAYSSGSAGADMDIREWLSLLSLPLNKPRQ